VKSRLNQSNSSSAAPLRAIHYRLHERAANAEILGARVDRDGADPMDRGSTIKAITAHNAVIDFSNDAVEIRTGKHHGNQTHRSLPAWKIARKTVRGVYRCKGVVTNPPAFRNVVRLGGTNHHFGLCVG
jgi:hypothetical protein